MSLEVIFSGFGGQGIMLMGQLLAQAGLEGGMQVSWIPSYGPEMRGGTAYCSIVLSEDAIGSPVVTSPDLCFVMNLPSLHRFASQVKPGGVLLCNSSLVKESATRDDIKQFHIPVNDIAMQLGNIKVLNVVGLGAVAAVSGILALSHYEAAMKALFGKKHASNPEVLELNKKALHKGFEAAAQ